MSFITKFNKKSNKNLIVYNNSQQTNYFNIIMYISSLSLSSWCGALLKFSCLAFEEDLQAFDPHMSEATAPSGSSDGGDIVMGLDKTRPMRRWPPYGLVLLDSMGELPSRSNLLAS
jgi:hypothetical protein